MLIYNHAYDIYHTMFRMLHITESINSVIEVDKLRILDFYLAFPSELLEIQHFRGFKRYEKYLFEQQNKYERVIDRKRLFFKIEHIQLSAMKAIISYGLFDADEFKNGKIKRTNKQLSPALYERMENLNSENSTLLSLITGPLAALNLYGHLGLKERTNLIEFRYDSI